MAVCQNLVPLVNIKIAGKWMFIPLKMVLIGIDPYPHGPEFHAISNVGQVTEWPNANATPTSPGSGFWPHVEPPGLQA